jgi:hypothetical protein
MESEAVIPVEDWSKFIHGCAVLLPETVRAVPYWMDDSLIELSVEALQSQMEAEEARRDQLRLQSLQGPKRNSSTGGLSSAGVSSSGGADASLGADGSRHLQQQSPMLQRLTGSFKSALNRTSSGTGSGAAATGVHQMLPQLQQQQHGGQAGQGTTADTAGFNSSFRQSRLRVSTTGAAPGGARVSWADGGAHSTSSQAGGTPTQQGMAMAAAAAAGTGVGWLTRLWRLVRKEKPPPLFRPEAGR